MGGHVAPQLGTQRRDVRTIRAENQVISGKGHAILARPGQQRAVDARRQVSGVPILGRATPEIRGFRVAVANFMQIAQRRDQTFDYIKWC